MCIYYNSETNMCMHILLVDGYGTRVILRHPEWYTSRTPTNGSIDARAIWYIFLIFPKTGKYEDITKFGELYSNQLPHC